MITVVLARPEIPANIGFIARTMSCHGLTDLRVVGSPGMAAHPDAVRTASGEEAILQGAREFERLEDALADCHHALAFSRRVRDPGQRILDLPDAALRFGAPARSMSTPPDSAPVEQGIPVAPESPGTSMLTVTPNLLETRLALVFGRESQGLSREETFCCTHLVRIPLPGPLLSLNLSHAVAIALYAFFGGLPGESEAQPPAAGKAARTSGREPAFDPQDEVLPLGESEKVLSAVITRLLEGGQLKPAKAEAHVEYLRILWQRLQPTRREVEFLAGMLEKLAT
jgi:tRNA C32,U32 (ribose-2'-O)-methylase TrmJ